MPPLSLTQAKYALIMFGPSVKSVPGCLVSIVPMLIGVPVALTPGLGPHDEVLTAVPLLVLVLAAVEPALAAELLAAPLLPLLLLLHAARGERDQSQRRQQRKPDPSLRQGLMGPHPTALLSSESNPPRATGARVAAILIGRDPACNCSITRRTPNVCSAPIEPWSCMQRIPGHRLPGLRQRLSSGGTPYRCEPWRHCLCPGLKIAPRSCAHCCACAS